MPKGNPNPSPATRFSADNPGRAKQKGARDRLSAAFLNDFADDYDAHGKAVIETVRAKDPIAYVRIAAALLPTKVEITEARSMASATNSLRPTWKRCALRQWSVQ